jgi:hypothetical protein
MASRFASAVPCRMALVKVRGEGSIVSARPFAPRLQQADGGRAVLLHQTSSERPRSTSAAERPPRTPQPLQRGLEDHPPTVGPSRASYDSLPHLP